METEQYVFGVTGSYVTLDEKSASLLEDDSLAAQEYGKVFGGRVLCPEEELMGAVLDEAIADYRRYLIPGGKGNKKRFNEVEAWVLKEDYEWIFSFVNCCEALGLDPHLVRAELLVWKERTLAKISIPPLIPTRKKMTQKLLHRAACSDRTNSRLTAHLPLPLPFTISG
jgi:hypothetical protein